MDPTLHRHEKDHLLHHWQTSEIIVKDRGVFTLEWREGSESRTYPPFTPGVNDTITQHQPTVPTNEISTTKLLDNVGVRISAFWADQTNGQVWPECWLMSLHLGRSEGKWLCVSHGVKDGSGEVSSVVAEQEAMGQFKLRGSKKCGAD
jgi:hypothetical protein